MNSRQVTPRVLIDIKRIPELQSAGRDDGSLVIAAAVRQSRLHDDADIGRALPILAEASRHIGHPETRHRGTVGGSLAHADPIAELPTLAVGLGAQVVARSTAGERTIAAAEFVTGPRRTTLQPDEILVEARFPLLAPGSGWGFAEIVRRHGDPALATAVAVLRLDDQGAVADVAVTLGAVAGRPQRAQAVESAVRGAELTPELIADATRAAGELAEADPEPGEAGPTPHPPGIPLGYRRRLAAAVAAQALAKALARAKGGDAT
jgi:carbon-monoxide dehydrogenase medium subunit